MGIYLPESNFQPPYLQFSQYSFPDFAYYTPFPEPPSEEKFDLKRSTEAMFKSQQQIQNLLNSQSFLYQTSYTPFLDYPIEEKSELEKSLEVFCETAQQFQNILDSLSQQNFQESYSSFSVAPIQNKQPSILEMNMELLRESE